MKRSHWRGLALGIGVALIFSGADVAYGSPEKHSSSGGVDPQNQYLSTVIGADGRFSQGAFPGPNSTTTTDSYSTLYGWPQTGTSFTTIRVDGNDTPFGDGTGAFTEPPTDDSPTSNQSTWRVGSIQVRQTISLVSNPDTGRPDTAEISYTLTNEDTAAHAVGLRAMLDTDVNSNDGAPFRVPGLGAVTTEQDLTGGAVPDSFQVFSSLEDSQHIAAARLEGGAAVRPDRLVIARWPELRTTLWDYTTDSTAAITADSAYALYWNPTALSPGASRTVTTCYGLSNVTVNLAPPLALGLSGPTVLTASTSGYSPNPFTVTATISNSGSVPATSARVTLTLPAGLTTTSPTVVNLGDLAPGAPEQQVSWTVSATPRGTPSSLTYGVTASAANATVKTLSRTLQVPASQTQLVYAALGDSYSSGEGVSPFIGSSATSLDQCHRSTRAYSKLLSQLDWRHPTDPTFVACSGAITNDLYSTNHDDNLLRNPSTGRLYIEPAQLSALTQSTQLVTLTIGGNDLGFVDVLEKCLGSPALADPHCQNTGLKTAVSNRLNALKGQGHGETPEGFAIHSWISVIRNIHAKSPSARILISGYPQLFNPKGPGFGWGPHGTFCTAGVLAWFGHSIGYRVAIFQDEATWIASEISAANTALKAAVAASGVSSAQYVDPTTQFSGHALCDANPWIQQMTGNTDATASYKKVSPSSGHPTYNGQAALERSFASALA